MPRQAPARDRANVPGYDARAALLQITLDPDATATARAAAARTLAEMDGLIGRHQQAPERHAVTPISQLSRQDLEAELARLRAVCARDKAQDNG